MAVVTPYRLAEEIKKILDGGDSPVASNVSINEIKISIGQVANSILRTEHFQINEAVGEKIPNGSVLGWYENVAVTSWNNKSKATLPIKPMKLPRNMGIWGVYPKFTTKGWYELDKEFIPLQMGQSALIKSQPILNDLSGQIGYEQLGGNEILFTKDIKVLWPEILIAFRLVVLDMSLYGDYDILPVTPEMEWEIKKQVVEMYSKEPIPDKIVDISNKERKDIPINEQKQ